MLIFLLCWISVVSGDYLFTLPRTMEEGTNTHFCLILKDLETEDFLPEQGYIVNMTLNFTKDFYYEMRTVLLGIKSQDGDFQTCYQIPAPSEEGSYTATINVSVTYTPDGQNEEKTMHLFNSTRDIIKVTSPNLITLVQTDKPIYKPGQTVKFRVMTMDHRLKAKTNGYSQIKIETPNALRVMQWDDVPAPNGLVSLEMPLSSDPVLGNWKITATYGSTDTIQTFKVDEYVLPKFEVTVTTPTYLLPTTKTIHGTVCAKYTYGKPVKGTLKMNVCYKPAYVYNYYYYQERPCADIIEKIDGCYEYFIDAEDLKLKYKGYSWGQLRINATVTEDETGVELLGSAVGPSMSYAPLNLVLEDDVNNYFKPGFPYKGRVVVTNPDGTPAPGELIYVEGTDYKINYTWANNFTSDENGIIRFTMLDLSKNIGSLNLRAEAVAYDWRYSFDELYVQTYMPRAYCRLTQWYSASDSYLYLPDVDEAAECDSELMLDVYYTAEMNADYKFMAIVRAGDNVVYTKEHMIKAADQVFDLDILSVDESELLVKSAKTTLPTLPPLPTEKMSTTPSPPENTTGPAEPEPEPVPVIEEEITAEVYIPLGEDAETGEGSAPRRKRGTGSCIQEMALKENFIDCALEFSSFLTNLSTSGAIMGQGNMMQLFCTPEGKAAFGCVIDFIIECPDLYDPSNPTMGFGALSNIPGLDVDNFVQKGGVDESCAALDDDNQPGTESCALQIQMKPEFLDCVMQFSYYFSNLDMSVLGSGGLENMNKLYCSDDGKKAFGCIIDYITECPDLHPSNAGSPFATLNVVPGFEVFLEKGSIDEACSESEDGDQSEPVPEQNGESSKLIGHFKLGLPIYREMSPNAKVLIFYMREDTEVIAASLEFKVNPCFTNKVSMSFSNTTVKPGSEVNLNVGASPSSTCFVSMIDKSVTLLGGNNQPTPKQIFDKVAKVSRPYHYFTYWIEDRDYCEIKTNASSAHGEHYPYYYGWSRPMGVDALQAFRDASMWVATDGMVQTRPCQENPPIYYLSETQVDEAPVGVEGPVVRAETLEDNVPDDTGIEIVQSAKTATVEKIRSFFPETWLWDIVIVGDDGELLYPTTIPDTITEWIGSTVCTHEDDGVGVSELTGVTAFQPFFVSLTLPYSAVRGEILPLLVTVFNYLPDCLTMEVQLQETEGFEFAVGGGNSRQFCLCGGESESTTFHIIPVVVGEIDIEATAVSIENSGLCDNMVLSEVGIGVSDGVQRQLLIEAEGVPQDLTWSSYICVQNDELASESFSVALPEDLVPDSERAKVSVVGDIMGPTLSNLKNLLRMPYGCGEQNMASWSPNTYVLLYLESTEQLTMEVAEEAKGYMRVGYQRQMKYRHNDYSYSAWGENKYGNATGSLWLTAFVVKAMAQSSPYIVIDIEDIKNSAKWLVEKQQEGLGCFPQVGRVFSSYLRGGFDGDNPAGLTAFTLIALMEADLGEEFNQSIANGFNDCLNNFLLEDVDTYTLSLMSYAYTLWNLYGWRRSEVMMELEKRQVTEGDLLYWKREEVETTNTCDYCWYYRAPSAEVEMTAYVMMSMLAEGPDAIGRVEPIVRWLSKQRNPYGGFSSTQDTVVALQALAKFASMTFTGDSTVNVEVKTYGSEAMFTVTPSNSLIYQSQDILPTDGAVDITASGSGCALVQLNMKYNIYTEEDSGPAFDVTVSVFRARTGNNQCAMRTIEVCTSYLKSGGVSNMAIAEVKMPTGWAPISSTLDELVNADRIQKYEVDKNYVELYFDEISKEKVCVDFDVEQEIEMNPKPALVKVYDYYETSYSVTRAYEIETTCGTKEEIPFDNEGLDCSIMQCRIDPKVPEVTCPYCADAVEDTELEDMVCSAQAVYKALVARTGQYSIKLKADLRPKKKVVLDLFANYKMGEMCSCPILQGEETRALIVTKNPSMIDTDSKEVWFQGDDAIIPLLKEQEKIVRQLSSKTKLCSKLDRLKRSGSPRSVRGLERIRRKYGVL